MTDWEMLKQAIQQSLDNTTAARLEDPSGWAGGYADGYSSACGTILWAMSQIEKGEWPK